MRLNKYIAGCGICSRRKAEQLISDGHITINGEIIEKLATTVDPDNDEVRYRGVVISLSCNFEYYILNKPEGVISSCGDTHDRKTVLDIVKSDSRLYPVGRLDFDSSGLIILTNDGEVTNHITHPSFEIEKEYVAVVKGDISEQNLQKLRDGVYIDGKLTSKAKVTIVKVQRYTTTLRFIIHEGRNRQIRNMVKSIGSHVYELERVRLGNLSLDGLKKGDYRKLDEKEIAYIKSI
jgi:23S rRNA pseudouridine2605 synthase